MNSKIRRNFSFYSIDSNNDGKTFYRSFRFVCLGVCIIGTLYLSLNNSYEYNTSEAIHFNNVNSRTLAEVSVLNAPSLGNENFKNGHKTNIQNTRSCCQNDDNTNNEENENNESENSTNDIDNRRQLKKQKLQDKIDALTSIPSSERLMKLWKQTIDVCTEGLQSVRNELSEYKEKYGEGYEDIRRNGTKTDRTDYHKEFDQRLSIHQDYYTSKFNDLIQKELTVDELRTFILIFIGFFHNLIDYLFHRYKIKYMQVGMSIPTEGTINETPAERRRRQIEEKREDKLKQKVEEYPGENVQENPEENFNETKKKKHKRRKHKKRKNKKRKNKKEDVEEYFEENHKENADENPEENIEENQE
ncbi:Plasmodium exported protein (PHISTa), unknown function [Plasmodium sp. gorilla clade G2]|uniref:Plasmodium exported protein (PHISTa), unknown function n=1 Tax=Plasmodium sp. gorilla clade G2 TaxID=880535 RepID=UPI000D2282AA|nr:Plasmodium exported protein (PHISTa), unknown function [Plasmodium sp. gorilla clade G2]SOV17171.1 Plasmodium exported protein (PHISTa), unknown function [Plasmodium sp. gorilla clade G2]